MNLSILSEELLAPCSLSNSDGGQAFEDLLSSHLYSSVLKVDEGKKRLWWKGMVVQQRAGGGRSNLQRNTSSIIY